MIARTAIETFDRCGQYADYAYLPDPASSNWSKRREQSFKHILATRDITLKVATGDMRRFLSSLKTPTAVLAANDDTAQKALAAVLAALGKSDVPIARIAHACGFPNPKSLGNLFRRRMGVSMSEWRQAHLTNRTP